MFYKKLLLLLTGFCLWQSAEAGTRTLMPFLPKADIVWESFPPVKKIQYVVTAGNPTQPGFFTVWLKIPANSTIQPYFHSKDEFYTVIEGHYAMGMGPKPIYAHAVQLPQGSFVQVPSALECTGWTKNKPVILQISGFGPWDWLQQNQKNPHTY